MVPYTQRPIFAHKGVSAQVIEHCVSPQGIPIISFSVTGHRYILAEVDTHRVFSRSFRSSRAVPVATMLSEVRINPMLPVAYMYNQKGMQAAEDMNAEHADKAERILRRAAKEAAKYAEDLALIGWGEREPYGLHKQWANRGLEAYLPFNGIITSIYMKNFYALRAHPDAMPEFKLLAELMLEAHRASTPERLEVGVWHMPYIDDDDASDIALYVEKNHEYQNEEQLYQRAVDVTRMVSGARCARNSFKVFDADRKSLIEEDLTLAQRLIEQGHWGPFEHQATPARQYDKEWDQDDLRRFGNFYGWVQSRKMFPNEHRDFEIYPQDHPLAIVGINQL